MHTHTFALSYYVNFTYFIFTVFQLRLKEMFPGGMQSTSTGVLHLAEI